MVKNLPAMQQTQVQSLSRKDPLEEGMATTAVFLAGEPLGWKNLAGYSPWVHKELDMTEHLILPADRILPASKLLHVNIKHIIPVSASTVVKANVKVDPWFWAVLLSHQLAQAAVKPVCED